jgi:hypothetical protein
MLAFEIVTLNEVVTKGEVPANAPCSLSVMT